jgi:hypothetical protein
MVWVGLMWLRMGTSGGFHKMLGSSWVAAQLAAPLEGLSFVGKYCEFNDSLNLQHYAFTQQNLNFPKLQWTWVNGEITRHLILQNVYRFWDGMKAEIFIVSWSRLWIDICVAHVHKQRIRG